MLTEQLDSLFSQTMASHINEVWVCVFSAPAHDYAVDVVKHTKYKNVRLVDSDFNFKFYGRFQVGGMRRKSLRSLRNCSSVLRFSGSNNPGPSPEVCSSFPLS